MIRATSFIRKNYLVFLFFLSFVTIVQNPGGFPYPSPYARYSDFTITHYPNLFFLKQSIMNGELPFWSPTIFSGYPYFANPLSGLFYPPGWIPLIFPIPLGINIVAALHLFLGGVGMFVILQKEGVDRHSAFLGAMVFQWMPKLLAHFGAGHLTLIYAVPWTPWLLWASIRARQDGGVKYIYPPIILALICLADVRWAVYASLLWVLYSIAHSHDDKEHTKHSRLYNSKNFIVYFLKLLPQIFLAIVLSCPLLFPLNEYTQLSTRVAMTISDTLVFSLPPARLLGLFFPDFGGNQEFMLYSGGGVIVLIFVLILRKTNKGGGKFWTWAGFFSLVIALGSNLPFYSLISKVPGFNLLRVPSRALFVTGFTFSAAAAHSCQNITSTLWNENRKWINYGLVGLNAMTLTLSSGVFFLDRARSFNFIYGASIILITSVLVLSRLSGKVTPMNFFRVFFVITLIDLGVFNQSLYELREKDAVFSETKQVADYLSKQEGYFRVYSPSYSVPQHVAVINNLELVDGVDPLHLSTYAEYLEKASGVPSTGYSVTIPPFENGNPLTDNINFLPDPMLLGILNTRFVVSEYSLNVEELELQKTFGQTRIYINKLALPRVWVQSPDDPIGFTITPASIIHKSPNQVEISATGPGLLVLSEINYPGWNVEIDGIKSEIEAVNQILRGVELPEGNHRVLFSFIPLSLIYGGMTFGVGIGIIFMFWVWRRRKRD